MAAHSLPRRYLFLCAHLATPARRQKLAELLGEG